MSTQLAAAAVDTIPAVSLLVWGIFGVFVAILLFLDLVVFNRKNEVPTLRHTVMQVALFVSSAMVVMVLIGLFTPLGWTGASQYLTAYVVEATLSFDNVFVMSFVMTFFAVPRRYQHKVLFYGVIGAIVMRLLFISVGIAFVEKFAFTLVVLGLFLLYTGFKLLKSKEDPEIEDMRAYKLMSRFLPAYNGFDGAHFLIRINRKYHATKLLQAVIVIEIVDLIFAADSVPAVLAITSNTFIAFSSNVMAILGLRSLYFLFDYIKDKLSRLSTGLAIILIGIGLKMIVAYEFSAQYWPGYHMPSWMSITFIFTVLAGSVVASLIWPKRTIDTAE